MATTENYGFWYLDPEEEISDFPNQWDYNIDKIDEAIHDASATDDVAASRITGTLAAARIPDSIARTSDVNDETAALDKRVINNADRLDKTDKELDDHGDRLDGHDTQIGNLADLLDGLDSDVDSLAALKDRIEELENENRSTGLRDITATIEDHLKDEQTGQLFVTRIGQWVTITFDMIEFDKSGWANIGYLPTGLRPYTDQHVPVFWGSSESSFSYTSMLIIRKSNSLSFSKLTEGHARATITYPTKDSWPSTLPGDPA